jgi:hypothetical protein
MDITPSPEFCAACRIVLGGDTLGADIDQVHADILAGKRAVSLPLDPPAGTLEPWPHTLLAVQQAVEL